MLATVESWLTFAMEPLRDSSGAGLHCFLVHWRGLGSRANCAWWTADDNLLPVVMFLVWWAVALAFYSPMCPLALLGKGPVHVYASLTRTVVVGTKYTPDLIEVVLKSEGSLFPVSCSLDS